MSTTMIKCKLFAVMEVLKISGNKALEQVIWDVIKEINEQELKNDHVAKLV